MKNKQTEAKLRSSSGLTRHLISGVLCLAVISLICARAPAQNLFAADGGDIDEFTPNGVLSTFASGLAVPVGLAFDSVGNLFVADEGSGAVYKFTPAGVRTTFASGLAGPFGLAFDSAGNLFVADGGGGYDIIVPAAVYKFTPSGLRSTVASQNGHPPVNPNGLATDSADNLFVSDGISGSILKFTPGGARTTFAYSIGAASLAFGPPSSVVGRAAVIDFNGDGSPDFVLHEPSTHQTAIWYLNNNVFVGSAYGPTLTVGWELTGVADFNRDTHPDYALFNPVTDQTAIWYLSGPTFIGSAYGPTITSGWALVGAGDFNGDGNPDYVVYKASTRQTAIWYLNNNVFISGASGPTLPAGWSFADYCSPYDYCCL